LWGELEHDFVVTHESEFIAGDPFDCSRVVLESFDFRAQLSDAFGYLGILLLDLPHFCLQGTQAWEALLREHEDGGSDCGHEEDEDWENAFHKNGQF